MVQSEIFCDYLMPKKKKKSRNFVYDDYDGWEILYFQDERDAIIAKKCKEIINMQLPKTVRGR